MEVKGHSSYKTHVVPAQYGEATLTLDITAKWVQVGESESRLERMRNDVIYLMSVIRQSLTNFTEVLKRQGYTCPLTGLVDREKPGPRRRGAVTLLCAHIIKRTVAVFHSAGSVSELEKSRVSIRGHKSSSSAQLTTRLSTVPVRDVHFGYFSTLHGYSP
jgi:hypothetical protein